MKRLLTRSSLVHSTAKGITVEGAGIIKIKHYEPGNSVWMLSSEPANGTAHGCGGSSIGWKFNEDVSQYQGGDAKSNPHMVVGDARQGLDMAHWFTVG